MSDQANSPERPLRRDAELNRQRILAAARKLLTERGLGVSHDEIAREAEVAVGTVYRRYPLKEQLWEALFVERVEAVVALADAALEVQDAWEGLTSFLLGVFEMQADDRGLREFMSRGGGTELAARAQGRIQPVVAELVRRAQADGTLRADLGVGDMAIIPVMVGAVMDSARPVSPELWRRMLALVIDGLAARPGTSPLPGDPPARDALALILSGVSGR